MSNHWKSKMKRDGMSNPAIDAMYDHAIENGAIGGKLVGAGGGGFMLFVTEQRSRLRAAMAEKGYREVKFSFDYEGVKLLNL